MAQSLEDLAEELTCSICLCLFSTPVTIPCGHNFCSQCLDRTWQGPDVSYSCPQCRCTFPSKPDLRKNTLLSNLVSQVIAAKGEVPEDVAEPEEPEESEEPEEPEGPEGQESGAVLCDSCRKTVASKTCLTCMASFCHEHLLPHLESPAFMDHQLSQPLGDLKERKCMEHNKLMDHYCWDHSKCICCYCALVHKQCKTQSLQEGKMQKEMYFIDLLRSLNQKLEKTTSTIEAVRCEQKKVMDTTRKKKELLDEEFEEIKALIDEKQSRVRAKVEEEEEKMDQKFTYTQNVLTKKKQEFEKLKTKVQSLLQEQDDLQFLKRATKLKDTTSKDPYKPKTELDEKLLQNIYKNAVSLKEIVKSKISQLDEAPEMIPPFTSPKKMPGAESAEPESCKFKPTPFMKKPEEKQKKNKPKINQFTTPPANDPSAPPPPPKTQRNKTPSPAAPPIPESREQLLRYAEKVTADHNTAHKKIVITDRFTKLAVSDFPQNYRDCPQRFVSCSQVLGLQGFSGGLHYWEVDKEGGNFSGIGVAYQSIPRNGTESRLGRNKVSWCIEWCNGKLQAWHDDKQTDLTSPNTNKYGVLLDYNAGCLSFFCIGNKFSQIYRFRARFTEPVFPAFWIFASKTVMTLGSFEAREP